MEANGTSQVGELASAPTRGGTHLPRRILVVDDEAAIRLFSSAVLRSSGYEVDAAEDGAAAWEALHAKDYDLLITDNQMPKISGVELIDKVHDAHMELQVIMASGALPADELSRNPPLPLVAALAKPFSSEQLLRKVESVLGAAESAPEPSISGQAGEVNRQQIVYRAEKTFVPDPFAGRNLVLEVPPSLEAAHLAAAENLPLKNAYKPKAKRK